MCKFRNVELLSFWEWKVVMKYLDESKICSSHVLESLEIESC